jgi:hypothetical protein
VLSTAWPFLAGSLTGYVVARAWRHPASLRSGAVIWLCTVSVGCCCGWPPVGAPL